MSDIKQPMEGAYKGVFIFTIVMAVVVFFVGTATGSKSHIGTLIWGYTAWLMYKRKTSQLVTLYKGLLWLTGFAALSVVVLFATYVDTLRYSHLEIFLLITLVFGVDYALLKFFQRVVANESIITRVSVDPQQATTSSKLPNDEDTWKAASKELATDRNEGLWAKCFAEADGDENKAKAAYLKNRFKSLSEEAGATKYNQSRTYINDRFSRDRLEMYNELKYSKYMTAAKLVGILAIMMIVLIASLS